MRNSKDFKSKVKKNVTELQNKEKFEESLARIKQLSATDKKKVQKVLKKLPKRMQESAQKLFE